MKGEKKMEIFVNTCQDGSKTFKAWFGKYHDESHATFDLSGNLIHASKSGSSTLREPTEKELEEARKVIMNALNNNYRLEKFYVRFGDLPKDGKSTNHLTGKKEKGVSVIEAKQNLFTGEIELVPYGSPTFMWVQNRPMYEVTGEYVGKGSDGEPLLKNAKILRRIK